MTNKLIIKTSKEIFASQLKKLSKIFKSDLTPEIIDIYYDVLGDISEDKFISACNRILETRVYPTFPMPADFFVAIADNAKPLTTGQQTYLNCLKAFKEIDEAKDRGDKSLFPKIDWEEIKMEENENARQGQVLEADGDNGRSIR